MIFWYSSLNELRQNPDVINSEEAKSKKENQEINVARAGSEVKLACAIIAGAPPWSSESNQICPKADTKIFL